MMNTKSSMEHLLQEKVYALKEMIEPEEFAAAAKELLDIMRTIPLGEIQASLSATNFRQWTEYFELIKKILVMNSENRKRGSKNKEYYKPSLNIPVTKDLLFTIHLMIFTSNLPDYYMSAK